jgi:hypothetical protein
MPLPFCSRPSVLNGPLENGLEYAGYGYSNGYHGRQDSQEDKPVYLTWDPLNHNKRLSIQSIKLMIRRKT